VTVDPAGTVYACNLNGTITVYPPGADGDVAPSAVLDVPAQASTVRLDRHGNIYVGVMAALDTGQAGGQQTVGFGSIVRYAAGATGATVPQGTISGLLTGLSSPLALLIQDPDVKVIPYPLPKAGGGN
jgi:hypothetical protein